MLGWWSPSDSMHPTPGVGVQNCCHRPDTHTKHASSHRSPSVYQSSALTPLTRGWRSPAGTSASTSARSAVAGLTRVRIEVLCANPGDLRARLDLMRRNGENETVEFKEALPKGDGIPRAIAAFANGGGGTIIVGIEDGTGEVAGVEDAATCRDTLVDIVRNRVRPSPPIELFPCTLQGRERVATNITCAGVRLTGSRNPKRCGRSRDLARPIGKGRFRRWSEDRAQGVVSRHERCLAGGPLGVLPGEDSNLEPSG
ncbi:MAG: ATP-binding protein [Dehalococcoidia bacterium]|nr:ATP-binding protein [Dehalococcoidia bacterium]